MKKPKSNKLTLVKERSVITRRVMRNFMQRYFNEWKKVNKVSGKGFKGMTLEQKIKAIGGIK